MLTETQARNAKVKRTPYGTRIRALLQHPHVVADAGQAERLLR
jgi:hypothetical protein